MAHSNQIFDPNFQQNFKFPSKTPVYKTLVHTPVSEIGEIRASLAPYPIWEIVYDCDWARGGEQMPGSLYQYLLGFFMAMGGMFSDFLYVDPNDNTVSQQFIAIADGTATQFQLQRSIGIGYDIVQNLNGAPTLFADNSAISSSDYTITSTGIVIFGTAPTSGVLLTWSGSFYYRVRFDSDAQTFDSFAKQIWNTKKLGLKSVILGSVLS